MNQKAIEIQSGGMNRYRYLVGHPMDAEPPGHGSIKINQDWINEQFGRLGYHPEFKTEVPSGNSSTIGSDAGLELLKKKRKGT